MAITSIITELHGVYIYFATILHDDKHCHMHVHKLVDTVRKVLNLHFSNVNCQNLT